MSRVRTSAQKTKSKSNSLVAAFNDMERRIERADLESKIHQSTFTLPDAGPNVSEIFLLKPPFLADGIDVPLGSHYEKADMDYLIRYSYARYSDRERGITLY